MKLVKDLLYAKGNAALDIARLCAFISVACFWFCVIWMAVHKGAFDPVSVGTGCAAIMVGAGGWIFARQQHEEDGEPGK